MITNLVTLSITLLTNSQQAIVGEANGKALVASQETVIQRTITLEDVVLRSALTTNFVGFAFPPRPTTPPERILSRASEEAVLRGPPMEREVPLNLGNTNTPRTINTNSPAFKRRLEREQRLRPSTNAPPQQTK
jgi:hypothetical protein